jgi:hypothetical protein
MKKFQNEVIVGVFKSPAGPDSEKYRKICEIAILDSSN